jgi:hypothetical protein
MVHLGRMKFGQERWYYSGQNEGHIRPTEQHAALQVGGLPAKKTAAHVHRSGPSKRAQPWERIERRHCACGEIEPRTASSTRHCTAAAAYRAVGLW